MSEWKEPNPLGIFVTGVVGRAMGSGAFKAQDIDQLTAEAIKVYLERLEPMLAPPQRAAPPMPQRPPGGPNAGYVRPLTAGAPAAPQEVSLETSFPTWEHEPIGFGQKDSPLGKPWKDVTWSEAHRFCASGNAQVVRYVSWLSEAYDVGTDPRWIQKNQKMKRRATCVLAMARNGSRPPAEPVPETPF